MSSDAPQRSSTEAQTAARRELLAAEAAERAAGIAYHIDSTTENWKAYREAGDRTSDALAVVYTLFPGPRRA
jgi:hypothetical protein